MDKKKDKRKKKIKEVKEKKEKVVEEDQEDTRYVVDGLKKVALSVMTQKAIGCVIGDDLTTENPWLWVKKEKIEDNLELHAVSSEFLPIKQYIETYPEEDILLGYNKPAEDDKHVFYVCSSIKAKDAILQLLNEDKREIEVRLGNSIFKEPRIWVSYGSETEVNDCIERNMRPLIQIEYNTRFPIHKSNKKFSLRMVEDIVDGYVEVLSGRFAYENVYRRSVNAAVQVSPPTLDSSAQTVQTYPANTWTQYDYTYNEPKLSPENLKNLITFMTNQIEYISEIISVNGCINLYSNDYPDSGERNFNDDIAKKVDIVSFRDVLTCKGKLLSCVAPNPLVSGVIAASYSQAPANTILNHRLDNDQVNDIIFSKHLVLIWCNSNSLNPKLLLYCFREVNVVKYCPFKRDLLVGGCTNGQIVIWDLADKLDAVETREILNPLEQKHRLIMRSLVSWMKDVSDKKVVYPTVMSNLDYSHNDCVTGIEWILPQYEITRNGKLIKTTENTKSLQCMTCGLDGNVLIWDLQKKPHGISEPKTKKIKTSSRPGALSANTSEYKHLHNIWIPQYKLIVENPITKMKYPLTGLCIENINFAYKTNDTEGLDDYFKRTYFEPAESTKPFESTANFTVITKLGGFFHCSWEGHDFDQGKKVNYESCKITNYLKIHDGPLTVCIAHDLEPKLFLTVGGRVFAIWYIDRPDVPFLWRKSHLKYVSGMWSPRTPGAVVLFRKDGIVESWELFDTMKFPKKIYRLTGNQIMDVYGNSVLRHVEKCSYICTDITGAVRVYGFPFRLQMTKEQIQYLRSLVHKSFAKKEQLTEWLSYWKQHHGYPEIIVEQAQAEKVEESVEETVPAADIALKKKDVCNLPSNKWQEKQEKMMYNILLQKKKLNLAEIEQQKIPLQKLYEEQRQKQEKLENTMKNRDKKFDTAVKSVFKEAEVVIRKKFEVHYPEKVVQEMKRSYIAQYQALEAPTLNIIEATNFQREFSWSKMIDSGKRKNRALNKQLNTIKNRRLLYEEQSHFD